MPSAVHRIEVRPRPGESDPRGAAACRDAQTLGLPRGPSRIDSAAVYLIEGELTPQQVRQLADDLLADPVTEVAAVGAGDTGPGAVIEVHPLPGVMDPDAEAIESAVRAMGFDVRVRTARRYDMHGTDAATARRVAEGTLANPVIHAIYDRPHHPREFPSASRVRGAEAGIDLADMSDRDLARLSRDAHLFLSLEEMKAIQAEFRRLRRDPREIELETIAQTWSEHCVHKTFNSTIRYRGPGSFADRPGHTVHADGSVTIDNLFRSTIVAATKKLIAGGIDWCLSVFADNSGVIAFDDEHAVCFKVETHNHPSAIEPYGGAATGVGGCIRDVIGTGLAALPIASTDVFCVAHPDRWTRSRADAAAEGSGEPEAPWHHVLVKPDDGKAPRRRTPAPKRRPQDAGVCEREDRGGPWPLPSGCLHPRRILTQVVAGVRDYGNRMGIPTLNGAVWFHDDYVGNPLVFCGCVGMLPRDRIEGRPRAGDRILVLGGRTGRDGIHGATFSSAELSGTHADEFSHAVQIGNAVTEKKLLEAILEARDHPDGCLFHAITDCGAGGFSSAVGEMGRSLGAEVNLERAPLKYPGLGPAEIWISEAQERMVLAVPPQNLEALEAICAVHEVELCDLGRFGTEGRDLVLRYHRAEVGRLSMDFLHGGLPKSVREATSSVGSAVRTIPVRPGPTPSIDQSLIALLSHPNIASKHWIIRQYDHEVQGRSVILPLVGPEGIGPSDAAVILPVRGSDRGLAVANGLATGLHADPATMALAAVDECVRNLVCVGADPERIALLDNFCWPSCREPETLGALVGAAEACYDAALAYRAPFISGKDSLNNQFVGDGGRVIAIPPTLLVSGIGIVPDVKRCVTMDAKRAGNVLVAAGRTLGALGGSHYQMIFGGGGGELPAPDLDVAPALAAAVHGAIAAGLVRSAHDCSDGGLLVAAAEMALAGGLGLSLDGLEDADAGTCFCEEPARYLLEVEPRHLDAVLGRFDGLPCARIGAFNDTDRLAIPSVLDLPLETLRSAWRTPLDW